MHVTVTCYKQLTVKRVRTGEPPIFLGPLFIHDNSDFETYSHFFHHLKVKLMDSNLKSLVTGSDDEKALVKGITAVLPEATHVLCTRHLQENVKHFLTDDAVTVIDRNTILKEIFGEDGLVDAHDSICFDDKCEALENLCAGISEKFLNYFQDKLKTNIKLKVNKPLKIDQIDRMWKNNNCESMNHVLKQTVDWKTKTLTEFVQLTHELVTGQFRNLKNALVCTGEFRLADSHQQFQSKKSTWIKMTEQQRTNLYKRFRRHIDINTKYITSTDGQTTVVAPRTNGRKPGQRKRNINVRTVTINAKKSKHEPEISS